MTEHEHRIRLVLVLVAAFAAVAALLIWMSPYTLRDATLSFSFGSKTRGLLNAMGLPEGAYNVSRISVVGPDGPMPEMAKRSFEVRSAGFPTRQHPADPQLTSKLLSLGNNLALHPSSREMPIPNQSSFGLIFERRKLQSNGGTVEIFITMPQSG